MSSTNRTDSRAQDAYEHESPTLFHPDMQFVREVLQQKRERVIEFMARLECVPRILAAKNATLGAPLSASELEDVAQETMIVVWKKLPKFEGRASLETWVFRIAVFELMNRVRHAAHRRTKDLSTEEIVAAAGTQEPAGFEDYTFVYEALDQLPEAERLVVQAKHFEQAPFREIAEQLGISENTAKTRYYRALNRLRQELRAHEKDYE